jgi:hypothetical protein
MDDAAEKPYVDDLSSVPLLRIKLDDPSFGQEGDLDRVDPGLRSEHALDGLNESSRRGYMKGWVVGKGTHLDASAAGHALYSQLAFLRLLKGAAQRLIVDEWKLDLARPGGKVTTFIPQPRENG